MTRSCPTPVLPCCKFLAPVSGKCSGSSRRLCTRERRARCICRWTTHRPSSLLSRLRQSVRVMLQYCHSLATIPILCQRRLPQIEGCNRTRLSSVLPFVYSFVLQSLCYLAERRERNRKIHYVSHEHPMERRKSQKLSASVDRHLLTFNAFVKYLVHLQ